MEGKTAEIMMKEMRGIQPRCLSSLCFCLKDILNTNDKSEPVPHMEDSVRIIMSCLLLTKKMRLSFPHTQTFNRGLERLEHGVKNF